MDVADVVSGDAAMRVPAQELVDLVSEEEDEEDRSTASAPSKTPAATIEAGSDEEDSEEDWELDSVLEDTIQGMGNFVYNGEADICSPEEAAQYQKLLRAVGPSVFCEQTVESGAITAKKLITAFRILPPSFLDGQPDEAFYGLLSHAIHRELSRRIKLQEYNTIDDAVKLIKEAKNIIVLTGAGISTSLGIPDFRSKDVGLYAKLEHLGLQDPQEVFSLNLFHEDPSIFFSVAKDILPGEKVFTPTHAFIRLLEDQGKLLTNYTQNIDNIEDHAGISREKIVQCHGSFATATCVKCKHQVPGQDIFPDIRAGLIPKCLKCIESLKSLSVPGGMKRKRSKNGSSKKRTHSKNRNEFSDSSDEQDYEIPQPGIMKPDITFFGEDLPDEFQTRLGVHDKNKVDLVIVIGTSLKVAPVADVIPYLPAHVPQMYISRDPISHFEFDIDMLGECDVIVSELCKRIGWELKHEMIPKERKVDVILTDGFKSRHTFKEQKVPSST